MDAEEIRGYVNKQHYFTFKNERLTNPAADYKQWPFDQPFHLLLNIAVGGTWGGAQGVDRNDLAATNGDRLRPRLSAQNSTKAQRHRILSVVSSAPIISDF